MGTQATAEKLQKQYLDVKYIVEQNAHLPYRIDIDDEKYPVEVLRSKEILPGKWRYSVRVKEVEFYLYHQDDEWWME